MPYLKYFSTPTCGPCKMFKPVVQEVTSELGMTVQYIDASTAADSVSKYGITAVPTIIVVDDQGYTLTKHTGVMSKPQLTQILSQFR